jgi:hypothetical protein
MGPLAVFAFFTDVETLYRPMVSHYARVDQAFASFVVVFDENVFNFKCFHVHVVLGYLRLGRRISGSIRVRHSGSRGLGKR